jgi:hypothetical protein
MTGWTALPDGLAEEIGLIPAMVYSRVVRYCKMNTGGCYASLETIGDGLGISRMTVCDTLAKLVELEYLQKIDAPRPRTPHTYVPTSKYDLWAVVMGNKPYTPDLQDSTPDLQDSTPDLHNCTPRVSKKDINRDTNKDIKRDEPAPQFFNEQPANNSKNSTEPVTPVSVNDETKYKPYNVAGFPPRVIPVGITSEGFGYPSRSSPVAVAQRKVDALVKKSVAKSSAEIVAGWFPPVQEKVLTYVYAYNKGIAPDGTNVRKPDAAALIKQQEYAMDIDATIYSPQDFEDAARYYWRAWKGMLSLKKLRSELSEWDARGRPKAKVEEPKTQAKMINYEEVAAAEKVEWERLGCPKGWKPE